MQDNEKKPALRFKGFTDPWEQRKLGDAFERVVRKNTNNESWLPLTISAQDGLVDQITYFNNRVASRDVSNYYLVYNGEFAYNKSTSDGYPFGAVKRLDWYEKGVLSTLYIVFALKHPEKDDSDFMTVFYDTDRWHRGVAERAAEGARNHGLLNISAEDFFDIDTTMPEDKVEQEKIGRLLKKLDTLITLHQRKYEKLVNIKKSMLDKMFPPNGVSVPEIRFKGFTDPWEQRKLKELYFQLTERNADLLPYQKTLSVATMSFKTDGNGAADTSLANYKRLRTGDIAFEGHTSKEFRYGRFVLNDVGDGIMSPRFSALRPLHEMPINFWKYYIHYEPIMRKVLVNSTKAGTMMNELVINEFLQESILVPSVAEQQAIGRFFKQLDTLITLHQRKLEKLQNIKKSCLEKMFV